MNRHDIPLRLRHFVERCVAEAALDSPSSTGFEGTLLEQKGTMRLGPDKPWLPFTAEQTMDAAQVGFRWHARVKMAPLLTCVVDDAFEDGRGRLDAKILGVLPVAHARGVDVDRGEAQRYLAELVWCPAAFLNNAELRYRETDDGALRVATGDAADEDTWVDLFFDKAGDVERVSTSTRVRGDLGVAQPWEGRFFDYRTFGEGNEALRAPSRAEVGWRTPDGLYLYWRGEIASLRWRVDG